MLEGSGTVWFCLGCEQFQKTQGRAKVENQFSSLLNLCVSMLIERAGVRSLYFSFKFLTFFIHVCSTWRQHCVGLSGSVCWPSHLKFHAACPQASHAVNSSWYLLGSLTLSTSCLRDPSVVVWAPREFYFLPLSWHWVAPPHHSLRQAVRNMAWICITVSFTRTCGLGPRASYLFLQRLSSVLWRDTLKFMDSAWERPQEPRAWAPSWLSRGKAGILGHLARSSTVRTVMGARCCYPNVSDYYRSCVSPPAAHATGVTPDRAWCLKFPLWSLHNICFSSKKPAWLGIFWLMKRPALWARPEGSEFLDSQAPWRHLLSWSGSLQTFPLPYVSLPIVPKGLMTKPSNTFSLASQLAMLSATVNLQKSLFNRSCWVWSHFDW